MKHWCLPYLFYTEISQEWFDDIVCVCVFFLNNVIYKVKVIQEQYSEMAPQFVDVFFLRIGEPPRIFTSEKLCLCNASIHTHLSYCPAANEPN